MDRRHFPFDTVDLLCLLVDSEYKCSTQKHSTRWSILYSSNFKIYWDWLVFANNIQANFFTNMKSERGFDGDWTPTGGSQLTVKMFLWSVLNNQRKENLHKSTSSAPKQNRCKTGQLWLFNTFCYKHRFKVISNIKSILNNIPNEKYSQVSSATFYKSKIPQNLREKNK